jgi:hypothetical protein
MPTDPAAPALQFASRRHALSTIVSLLAWLTTVAPVVIAPATRLASRSAGLMSLAALLFAAVIRRSRPLLARRVGIGLFVLSSAACWSLAPEALAEVGRAAGFVGAAAWAAFAVSWPEPWSLPEPDMSSAPEAEARGLVPRRRMSPFAIVAVLVAALASLACMWLAWSARHDGSRASAEVLVQVLAVTASVALLTVAARVATQSTERQPVANQRPLRETVMWLLATGLAMLLAFALYRAP